MSEETATSSVPPVTAASGSQSQPLPDDELFVLKKHFICRGINLAVHTEISRKQLTAFVGANGDLSLHYLPGELLDKFVMRLIPWFGDPNKKITTMCFDPSGTWLLIAGFDSTIFIIPALALVDKGCPQDHRWPTNDVTIFPPVAGSQSNIDPTHHPTAIAWWQSLMDCSHTAVMANDRGDIFFISLATGAQIGVTYIRSPLKSLYICQDNSMDSLFLLITDASRGQWRLLLEQCSTGYNWLTDTAGTDLSSSQGSVDLEFQSRTATARSRLQGLKQLSVEKLAILRQKLAETRSKGVMSMGASKKGLPTQLQEQDSASRGGSSSSSSSKEDTVSLASSSVLAVTEPTYTSSGPRPERLSARVGDTFLQPQHARGRHLLSGYYSPSNILTVHGTNLEVVPLFVHKLPYQCSTILLTDRFIFVTDATSSSLSVISCQLSQCSLDGDSEFSADSLIETFTFPGEEIVAIFKCTESNYRKEESVETRQVNEDTSKDIGKTTVKTPFLQQDPGVKEFKPIPITSPPVDSCMVITNQGMYTIRLKTPATDVFLELVLKHQALERAERLALVFGLNLQQLLEHAGDLRLAARDFPNAVALYKLSRCRHLKSVLKFAAGGFSAELLSYVNLLFSSSGSPQQYLTTSEKIHLSNLAVMSNTEQVLRATTHRATLTKNFLHFLRENTYYDEVLAANVAGQTGLWDVLLHLCSERGLHVQVLEVLAKVFRSSDSNLPEGFAAILAPTKSAAMWMCASEPTLQQALLARAPLARCHILTASTHLPNIELAALQRLAALYDPSTPVMRPFMKRRFGHSHYTSESSSTVSGFADSCDLLDANVNEEAVFPVEQMLQTFLFVLLYIVSRLPGTAAYDPQFVKKLPTNSSVSEKEENHETVIHIPVQNQPLSAGFAHVMLVRNGSVYSWGAASLGCLGTGPTMSRFSTPQPLGLFPSLLLEVHSVACGRQHTLALTNNGVYSWGSSYFGQLGVGTTTQSPTPRMVETLCKENIVAVSAGQYHSLALTEDGRVFSWGWGVHGQLGHRSVEDEHLPRLIRLLKGQAVVQVSGGHGHSLVLAADGSVFTFGSNVFGQLGNGSCIKSTVPIKVAALPEPIVLVATAYFHNLAVSNTNQLYIWGSSPQALRLQAQAQKKARLLQQQCAPQSAAADPSPTASPSSSSTSSLASSSHATSELPSAGGRSDVESSNNCTEGPVDRKALKARLTLENIGHASDVPGTRGKVSMGPVHFDEEFPDVAKLDGDELVTPGHPAVVISPAVEFKGLSPPPAPTNSSGLMGLSASGTAQWDESQAHLLPQRVDTGLVVGSISQISCGCHHSALLSSEGVLYTWGRNLDGQVGNGARKEVPLPTPLSCAPTVSMKSAAGGMSNALPATGMQYTRLQTVKCGCEFTTALEMSGGRVWAWGNNSQGQLGFPPVEDTKPLDGKLVMLRTSKRVIKLPHGMHNSCDLPREVAGLPPPALYSLPEKQSQGRRRSVLCDTLSSLEKPPYGVLTLHAALQYFHGLYDAKIVLAKCIELENYQAAARVAALDCHYPMALAYQLRALARSVTAEESSAHSDVVTSSINLKNDLNASRSSTVASTEIKQELINNRASEEITTLKAESTPGTSVEKDKGKRAVTVAPSSVVDSVGGSEENQNPSVSSTPESVTSLGMAEDSEMHAFSIQGGREQMSEVGRTLGSPDSGLSQPTESPAHQPVTCTVEREYNGSEKCSGATSSPQEAKSSNGLVQEASALVEYYVSLMEEESHVMMSQLLEQGFEFWLQHALPMEHLEKLLLRHLPKFCYSLGLLLFCRDSSNAKAQVPTMLHELSTRFCLHLCSILLDHINKRMPHIEYIEALSKAAAGLNGCAGGLSDTSEQQLETVLSALRGTQTTGPDFHSQPYITFTQEDIQDSEELLLFSCGHQYGSETYQHSLLPELENAFRQFSPPLVGTAHLLKGAYSNSTVGMQLACPRCVLSHIQGQVLV